MRLHTTVTGIDMVTVRDTITMATIMAGVGILDTK
jgi:hypothetical protein